MIKLSPDMVVINGKLVQLETFNDLKIGVRIDKDFYPLVTNHLGSVRGMISPDGKDVLWRRDYSAWRHKKTLFNEKCSIGLEKIKKLEELVIWSYAGLMEIPRLNENSGNILYWSQSRVYSPDIQEWLSIDPLVRMKPSMLLGQPGNWKGSEYASNDPVNFVDSSGHASLKVGLSINADFIGGKGLSGGLAFACCDRGLQVGFYGSNHSRLGVRAGGSLGIDVSVSNARSFSELNGKSFGWSGDIHHGFGFSLGVEDSKTSTGRIITEGTFSFGVGESIGHSFSETKTSTHSLFEIGGGDVLKDRGSNAFDSGSMAPDLGIFKGPNPYSD